MASHKTDEELEDFARSFLKSLGLEYQLCPDLMTMIIKIRHRNPGFKYARVPDSEMPHAEAYWYSEESVLAMRESVFVGMQRNAARPRMTVAHELSHYLLKHVGLLHRSTVKTIREIAVPQIRQQESEARRLAPIILAPEYLIPNGATPAEIARMFNFTDEAAMYRKADVDALRRRRRGETRALPKSVIDYLAEAQRRGYTTRSR